MLKSKVRTAASTAIALGALMGTPVMAQVSDNATVDANATLQQVVPPLSVNGFQSLELGTVNIPNGSIAGNQCAYDLRANNSATISVTEVNSTGATVDATFPTPSSCEASGEARNARFAINCSAATPTTLTYALTSPLSGDGATLSSSSSTEMAAVQQDSTGSAFVTSSTTTMVATCPDGSGSGATPGAFDVLIGGRLTLQDTATPGANITVGTITLTATY